MENDNLNIGKDDFLSRKQAVAFLASLGCPLSYGTLGNMASNNNEGKGPPFHRIRWRIVRYKRQDLMDWVKKETVRVT